MTTPRERDYAPVLDRLLQRVVTTTVEVPATISYVFDAMETMSGDRVDDGEWRRDSETELAIGLNDSNGLVFPFPDELTLPIVGVTVAFDGAAATTLTLTASRLLTNIQSLPLGHLLTFDGTLPAAGTALTLMFPSVGTQTVEQTATRPVWAARRDYRGRDFLQVEENIGSIITRTSTRFVVRAEGPAWATGDTFTDDKGKTQTVQGVGEIGRGRWLELLTQSVGS